MEHCKKKVAIAESGEDRATIESLKKNYPWAAKSIMERPQLAAAWNQIPLSNRNALIENNGEKLSAVLTQFPYQALPVEKIEPFAPEKQKNLLKTYKRASDYEQ